MSRRTPTADGPRGTAVSQFEAGIRARDENQRWFIQRLLEAGWPLQAVATHFGFGPPRARP